MLLEDLFNIYTTSKAKNCVTYFRAKGTCIGLVIRKLKLCDITRLKGSIYMVGKFKPYTSDCMPFMATCCI